MFKCQECVSVNVINPEMKQKLKVEKHYLYFFPRLKGDCKLLVTEFGVSSSYLVLLLPLLRKAEVTMLLSQVSH